MSVHVDELHTELRPTGAAPHGGTRAPDPPGAARDRWQATREEVERLRARVASDGFDD